MGEGKSVGLAWSAFYHTRHNPGAEWAIIRDTWENMQATTMKSFFEWFPPGVAGTFHATKKVFTWASGLAEGEVQFLGMDDPQDASKLMSRELAGFGIDEPAPAIGSGGVDELIFDIGMSRLRQSGMKWYGAKLAENNPDENHWTYRKFVSPGTEGYTVWQPTNPENSANLPPSYYADLRKLWGHRPDLLRRFVDGEFGFQQLGKAVTPQWADKLHLATGLSPIRGDVHVLWDFGHNPTAIFTQVSPLGHWYILDALVGEGTGVEEFILDQVKPLIADRYKRMRLRHTGDPAGNEREQTSISRTAVRYILNELGGTWRSGPKYTAARIDPLQAILGRTINGRGLVQVDRERAKPVWQAMRGGWHYHVARSGLIGAEPVKDQHSHPGDAMGYGAAILFPLGKLNQRGPNYKNLNPAQAQYFEADRNKDGQLQIGKNYGRIPPKHGSEL